MKKFYKKLDFIVIIKYLLTLFIFIIFNNLEKNILPYSASAFIAFLPTCNTIALTASFILSFAICGATSLIPSMLIFCGFYFVIKLIYSKQKRKKTLLYSAFSLIAMLGFVILGEAGGEISVLKRVLVTAITCFLSLAESISVKAVCKKGLKYKMNYEEIICIFLTVCLLGIGICNFISPLVWKGFCIFAVLFISYLYRFGTGAFVSALFGVSLAIFYGNLDYISMAIIWGITADGLTYFSRYFSAIMVVAVDLVSFYFFKNLEFNFLAEFLPSIIGAVIFVILPNKPLSALKEKLYSFREKQLIRQTINRNRLMLSNRLYELSGVFTEMASAFSSFKQNQLSESAIKDSLVKEICSTVCEECENKFKCKKEERIIKSEFNKMIEIGFAKGKLSFIDIPVTLANTCIKNSEIIFGVNKMLASYRSYMQNANNMNTGRDLISAQTEGVAEILKGLALESGSLLKYQSRVERKLTGELLKKGFFVSELLIYGEEASLTVSIVLCMKEFSLKALRAVISAELGYEVELTDKNQITEEKCYLIFKKANAFDAIFGVARATKDNSSVSGDTHSVIRINEDKFLVALSDGMGSGKKAEEISAMSLSLIESFYKAGMGSNLILSTVNKLLAINTEDSYTALDVSVIDLSACRADFIKYGAPYGFIVNANGVKIVESNTLPLGILKELSPSVCSTELSDGDMILLITDGVSDAFVSSNEIIDFLRKAPAKNPQTLADNVLAKAIEINGGEKKDDMTCLAVRIFKRNLAS